MFRGDVCVKSWLYAAMECGHVGSRASSRVGDGSWDTGE